MTIAHTTIEPTSGGCVMSVRPRFLPLSGPNTSWLNLTCLPLTFFHPLHRFAGEPIKAGRVRPGRTILLGQQVVRPGRTFFSLAGVAVHIAEVGRLEGLAGAQAHPIRRILPPASPLGQARTRPRVRATRQAMLDRIVMDVIQVPPVIVIVADAKRMVRPGRTILLGSAGGVALPEPASLPRFARFQEVELIVPDVALLLKTLEQFADRRENFRGRLGNER